MNRPVVEKIIYKHVCGHCGRMTGCEIDDPEDVHELEAYCSEFEKQRNEYRKALIK